MATASLVAASPAATATATVTHPATSTTTSTATAAHTPTQTATATATASPTSPPPPPQVAIISIDGLRPDAVLQVQAPNLLQLAAQGAHSWEAQTVVPPATLPAHASMLSGRLPEAHGITWNDYLPARGDIQVPTIFSAAEAAGLRTVMVVGKEKLAHLAPPGSVDEYIFARGGDRDVVDQAIAAVADGFDLLFVHLPNIDYFGHSEGWMSETYLAQIQRTDEALGRLLAALPDTTTVIVTADHGGHEFRHGSNIPEDMTIPWLIAGPGVRQNHTLAAPVNVADTAPTAAHVLGLEPLSEMTEGAPVLEAFGQATSPDLLAGEWTEGATQQPARSEMPAAVLDVRIYVPGGFGGERTFQAYDPAQDAWLDLAPLPDGRHHLMAAALEGRVYVFGGATAGGWTPTDTAWAYDPESDSWTDLAAMPEARLGGAAVALDGKLYVVGGVGGSSALLAYDPAADAWQALAPLQQPREHVAAAVLDGEIYALGGRWGGVGELASVEIYDPASNAWREGAPLLEPRAGFGAAVLHGRLLVAGGEIILRGNATLNSFEVFDPATQSWAYGPELPYPVSGVPAAADGQRFYLLGGSSRAGAVENAGRVLIYTPAEAGAAAVAGHVPALIAAPP